MRVVDLFCGAGGFSEGFRQAGHEILLGIDNWEPAIKTYQFNHRNSRTILGDIVKISYLPDNLFHEIIPDTEIIIGSPPCVSFSNSNNSGKAEKSEGISLVLAFLRIVARKKWRNETILKFWIMENVPNSAKYVKDYYCSSELGLGGGGTLIVKNSTSRVYNASYFGVPSRRKRFLCGEFPEPVPTNGKESKIPLAFVLNTLGEPYKKLNQEIKDPLFDVTVPGNELTDHHYVYPLAEHQWEKAKRLKLDKGYMGKMSFPEDVSKPARTIMATITFGARESMIFSNQGFGYRAPTIREVASLMSFPITYIFNGTSISQKYRLVGNAVPPKMSFAFGTAIQNETNGYWKDKIIINNYSPDSGFTNLNEQNFIEAKEQSKNKYSKFKYHVPYLIIDRYRVELTNHHSDFQNGMFLWNVEVRHAQGPQAKIYLPDINDSVFSIQEYTVINDWIESWINRNPIDGQNLQENYIIPGEERETLGVSGPIELLQDVGEFVTKLNYSKDDQLIVSCELKTLLIPKIIYLAYFVLVKIIERISGGEN